MSSYHNLIKNIINKFDLFLRSSCNLKKSHINSIKSNTGSGDSNIIQSNKK